VRSVVKGSPADKAGIKAGDIVLRVDDAKVMTPAEISMKARTLHGKPAPVVVMRDHKELTVTVTFDDAPGGMIQITPFQVHQPQERN
jgi:serine protease Do